MTAPILRNKLESSALIILFMTLVGTSYQLISEGYFLILGPIIGMSLGVPLALLEEFIFPKLFQAKGFTTVVLAKTLIYLIIITTIFFGFSFFVGLSRGLTMEDFVREVIYGTENYQQIATAGLFYLVTIFFIQLNKLLGPGVLLKFLRGHYHTPRIEQRVFMFLDLKSSTQIAEQLGHYAYYSYLNDFIRDISDSVVTHSAQIYQYVGDEIVLTWKTPKGIENVNCLNVFYGIQDRISEAAHLYQAKYEQVPEFKAGVHCGEVISAEIGDLKKDIVYNGDVLNTTSRIQGLCNQLNSSLLISSELAERLGPVPNFETRSLGSIDLKGKAEPMELIAINRRNNTPSD